MRQPVEKPALARKPGGTAKSKRPRDPVKSKQTILRAAVAEFCQHGFSGARIERIAAKSKCNMRMIYHYFGDKEGLYLAVLESAYTRLREQEKKLDLSGNSPTEGMRVLIRFTFDFFESNKDVLALISGENTLRARYLRKLPNVRAMTVPLLSLIGRMLVLGHKQGQFRPDLDPMQIYVSLVALSQLHILNKYTLSVIFDKDISASGWLVERRSHVEDLLMAYLLV